VASAERLLQDGIWPETVRELVKKDKVRALYQHQSSIELLKFEREQDVESHVSLLSALEQEFSFKRKSRLDLHATIDRIVFQIGVYGVFISRVTTMKAIRALSTIFPWIEIRNFVPFG
jgi:hypothetical protein